MKEYQVIIKGQSYTIKQDEDGKFIIPDFIKEYEKFGSALKPAFEPIIVARKPFSGSLIDNVLKWGVGGINIDECRVELEDTYVFKETNRGLRKDDSVFANGESSFLNENNSIASANPNGRFPANIITDGSDEATEGFPNSKGACSQNNFSDKPMFRGNSFHTSSTSVLNINNGYREWYNDDGSASRYFYCAKASKKDRNEGLDGFDEKRKAGCGYDLGYLNAGGGGGCLRKGKH